MVTIYDKEGNELLVHSIDAREIVDNVNYFTEKPELKKRKPKDEAVE